MASWPQSIATLQRAGRCSSTWRSAIARRSSTESWSPKAHRGSAATSPFGWNRLDEGTVGKAMNWKESAAALRWNVQPFIGGRFRESESEEQFDDVNPATETALCRVKAGSDSDIDEAVRV